jgi:NAD(P)-dependent dehydrogenase (short-subunit alcohol dehydrogenase family)
MICERFASAGCNVAVNYLSSEDSAKEVAAKVEKHSVKAIVIQGVRPIAIYHINRDSVPWMADCRRMPASVQTTHEWSRRRPRV